MVERTNLAYAVILSSSGTGLGFVRALKKVNVPTVVICLSADEPAMLSRYPKHKHVVSPDKPFDEAILEVLSQYKDKGCVLFATSDRFIQFVDRNHEDIHQHFFTLMPGYSITEILLDKRRETQLIESIGVPLPKTLHYFPDSPEELLKTLELPILVKPRTAMLMKSIDGKKNIFIDTEEALNDFYQKYQPVFEDLLAQEVIQGKENSWGCNCTFDLEHNLVMACTYNRMRTSPANYGVTSYAISRYNPTIISQVQKLGKSFKYTGNAGIEFKYDQKDQKYKYIETNPRIGLPNYLHTRAGINNIYATYQLAQNIKPEKYMPRQREVIFISLFDDFYSRVKDGEPVINIFRHYLSNIHRPHAHLYFTWSDPLPGLAMFYWNCTSLLSKQVKKMTAFLSR